MKIFDYKAKRGIDEVKGGKISANSVEEVVERLSQEGFVAVSVKEEQPKPSAKHHSHKARPVRIKIKEHIVFSRQLASLLRSGIPILRAFYIMSEQTHNRYFSSVINSIAEDITNGQTLAGSLGKYPHIFSTFYIAMVKAGEDSGNMEESLARISGYYSKRAEFMSKVRSALVYPALILVVGCFTIIFAFTNIIPRLAPLFADLSIELPMPTKILLWSSDAIRSSWIWVLLGLSIFILIIGKAYSNISFRRQVSKIKLKIPLFGDFVFKSEFAGFARAMEMALHSGIPIISAISFSVPIVREEAVKDSLAASVKSLEAGKPFGETLREARIFPPFVYNLVTVGEESGRLEEELANIAKSFEDDCEENIRVLTTLIEPAMVLMIGLVVAFIVSAILLPIFQLNIVNL